VTAYVHSCVAHNWTQEPIQLFAVLLWQSHKGDQFHQMIFCKASDHKQYNWRTTF